jgi:hypothetical protein
VANFQLAGPDPMVLRRVTEADAAEVPDSLLELIKEPGPGGGAEFDRRAGVGRAYKADFRRYADIQSSERLVSWPCLFFSVDGNNRLAEGAIVLDPPPHIRARSPAPVTVPFNAGNREAYTKYSRSHDLQKYYWTWETAARIFLTAAGNYHELGTHLARTHLVMERYACR